LNFIFDLAILTHFAAVSYVLIKYNQISKLNMYQHIYFTLMPVSCLKIGNEQ